MPILKLVVVVSLALVVAQLLFVHAQAPQLITGGQEELVKEIRFIRILLESTQKEAGRREVLLERYRLQHNSVTALTDRLDAVRGEAIALETDVSTTSAKIAELQAGLVVGADNAEHKAQLDSQIKDLQMTLQNLKNSQIRLSDQEHRLSITFAAEDLKLRSLDSALETIISQPTLK